MLNYIISWSLKNRFLVLIISLILLLVGIYTVLKLPVDVFPDLNRPTVTIMTEAEGLAPEEVEKLVTFPLETMMNGIPKVQRVRSQSGIGLSVIYVEFDWGTNIYTNRQLVTEKINIAKKQLPQNSSPTLAPISSMMGEIMLISVKSKTGKTSNMELRTLADWTIRNRLLAISGIAQVINIGGEVKQYQILFSPDKLKQYNITIDELKSSIEKSNLNTTGGFIDSNSQEILIRNNGRFQSLEELKNTIVVYKKNFPITVGDIAEVKFGAKIKRGDGGSNASSAVIMSVSKQPDTSTIYLTKEVEKVIKEIEKNLDKDIEINSNIFRQANFINSAISNVIEAIRDGTIIVIIVLFIFLLNFRITLIILTTIPLSFIIAFLTFKAFGISINTMTLGGLAVAIGELVDDSIVDIENIFRRLKENKISDNSKPISEVIYKASLEIRSSIIYATFIVAIVFVPLFFLSGVEGRFLIPLGIAYIVSLIASLFVSITVTPVLASFLLKDSNLEKHKQESPFVKFIKKYDYKILQKNLDNPNKIIFIVSIAFLLSVSTLPFIGKEFLPPFNEGTLTINLLTQPGTSLNESNKIGSVAEKILLQIPEIVSTGRRTGRAELDEHAEGVHYSEIDVDLKESNRSKEEILNDIRKKLSLIPGVSINVGQPISHRIDHLMSGIRAQIAVKLFGDDLQVLRSKADEIKKVIENIEGTTDVQVEKQVLIPQLQFNVKREEALRYGLKPADITNLLQISLNGLIVTEAIEGQKRYDVIIRLKDDYRKDIENLKNLTIISPSGAQVPILSVAEITNYSSVNQVLKENSKRRIIIMANVQNRDLGSVVQDIKSNISEKINIPSDYFIEYAGQFEAQQEATKNLIILSIFSTLIVFFLLLKALGYWQLALQVMINIPLALIGAILSILITKSNFSVASLVGFISLIGITSRNGIMMISHYLYLMENGENFSKDMIIKGSLERLVPVLMTALTAGLSLIPLAIAIGESGKEILQPLAVVVLGGIITSTLLDQVVTPVIFYKFGKNIFNSEHN